MTKLYPLHAVLHFHITDGKQIGELTFACPPQHLPTEETLVDILPRIEAALPPEFRLMDREESMNYWLREEKHYQGSRLALPPYEPGEEWFDAARESLRSSLYRDEVDAEDEDV